MRLTLDESYEQYGLGDSAKERLARLGDVLLGAGFNVTSVSSPLEVERFHFLDALSLLSLEEVEWSGRVIDIGSGGGLPALVLGIATSAHVTALEAQRKKCAFIRESAVTLGLDNVATVCRRAEEYGRDEGRGCFDVAVSRAVAALPTLVEYSVPLLRIGGIMVAMKGEISNQEWIRAQNALGILGAGPLTSVRLQPFAGAENRWVYLARKTRETPSQYPRRPGLPTKRPLGE